MEGPKVPTSVPSEARRREAPVIFDRLTYMTDAGNLQQDVSIYVFDFGCLSVLISNAVSRCNVASQIPCLRVIA